MSPCRCPMPTNSMTCAATSRWCASGCLRRKRRSHDHADRTGPVFFADHSSSGKQMAMTKSTVPLRTPLFRGERRLRSALVGMPNAGKSTLFNAVSSTAPRTGRLAGTHRAYGECTVQIGFDEASVIELPSIGSLHHLGEDDRAALKYLLWGDERPPISLHEPGGPRLSRRPP